MNYSFGARQDTEGLYTFSNFEECFYFRQMFIVTRVISIASLRRTANLTERALKVCIRCHCFT